MSALPVEPAPARGERILVAAAREAVRAREPRRAWPRWLWAAPVVAASLAVVVAVSLRVDAPPPPSAVHEDPNALRGESFAKAPEPPPAAGAAVRAPAPAPPEAASAPAEPPARADAAGRAAKGAPVAREEAPRLAQRKAEAESRDRAGLLGDAAPPEQAPQDLAAERFASAPPASPPAAAAPAPAEAEAKRAEEAPPPARRAKALALARPGTADQDQHAASGAGAGAAPRLREALTPRDRALAAARARAGAVGFSMAGTTVEVGAPLTWAEWRAQHAPGSDAAAPDALAGRRFWPVVFLRSPPSRGGGLTVFVEDGTFRALAEVRGE
jgi:hypothetical protein